MTDSIVMEIIGVALTFVLSGATIILRNKYKIDFSTAQREALHGALIRGIQLGLDRKLTGDALTEIAIDYARMHSPEAVENAQKNLGEVTKDLRMLVDALKPTAVRRMHQ